MVGNQSLPNISLIRLKTSLIVSCQASSGEPLAQPNHIKALAQSAIIGGAGGLRLEGVDNIQAVRSITDLPIIGLIKLLPSTTSAQLDTVYITPTFKEANEVVLAGADIVAIDATNRHRPDGKSLKELIDNIHRQTGKLVMADVSSLAEGLQAEKYGADLISTTLCGYTEGTKDSVQSGPALELLSQLISRTSLPIILEGRVWHCHEVTQAFVLGAYAVVVGSAITRPQLITQKFVKAIPRCD